MANIETTATTEPGRFDGPVPAHVAIIMDGNGRWATARGLPRVAGHKRGAEAVRRTVRAAGELGIGTLTLFGFSSENWSRPSEEVGELMGLLRFYLKSEMAELHRNNVRFRMIGNRSRLPSDVGPLLDGLEAKTQDNDGLSLVIALSYGGRDEIVDAARALAAEVAAGRLAPEEIGPERFAGALQTRGVPDPDLILRTSGEQRLSNFLLWQCAYAEFLFVDRLWPDFRREDLEQAVREFQGRERRFGACAAPGA